MSEKRKAVTFYHSMVCPRCHVSGLLLKRALRKHPDIKVTRVEVLTNRERARRDGVKSIPALVADGRTLAGVILTPRAIEQFLERLDGAPG
jgi:hypothetical protein